MQEVFGEMLVVHPMERNETQLPSPHHLRRRIILKHKKLPDGEDEAALFVKNADGMLTSAQNRAAELILEYKMMISNGTGSVIQKYHVTNFQCFTAHFSIQ